MMRIVLLKQSNTLREQNYSKNPSKAMRNLLREENSYLSAFTDSNSDVVAENGEISSPSN